MIVNVAVIVIVGIAGFCIYKSIQKNHEEQVITNEILRRMRIDQLRADEERVMRIARGNRPAPSIVPKPRKQLDRTFLDNNPEYDDGEDFHSSGNVFKPVIREPREPKDTSEPRSSREVGVRQGRHNNQRKPGESVIDQYLVSTTDNGPYVHDF